MHLVFALVASLATACATSSVQADGPAVVTNPTAASHAELATIIGTALGNAPVTLADDVFVQTSSITIERIPRHDSSGQLLNGRVLEKPERFTLSLRGSKCVLTRESTGHQSVLLKTQCKALTN